MNSIVHCTCNVTANSNTKTLQCRLTEDHVVGAKELHFYVVNKIDTTVGANNDFSVSDVFGSSAETPCTFTSKEIGDSDSDDWSTPISPDTFGAHPVYKPKSLLEGTLPRLLMEFIIVNRE